MKLFLPLWIGTLLLSVVNRFTLPAMDRIQHPTLDFLFGLIMTAYVLAIIAIVVVAAIYVVLRFYHGLLKDEGYLTFTLPVSVDAILWAKSLTGILLLAGSCVVAVVSVLIMLLEQGDLRIVGEVLKELPRNAGVGNTVLIILFAVLAAISAALSTIYQAYLSMGIGQMAQKRKLGTSILAYVIISFVISFISGAGVMPLFVKVMEMLGQPNILKLFNGPHGLWLLFLGWAVYNLIYVVIFYFPTRYIFKNKLNLE